MARPRKTNVLRSSSGKSRGEPEVISPEVIAVREREIAAIGGINPGEATNRLAGFTLGQMLLRFQADKGNPGGISYRQYDSGERFAQIVRRHAAIMGYELKRTAKSPGFTRLALPTGSAPDVNDHDIARARDDFRVCYNALANAAKDHGHNVQLVVYDVCVDNRHISTLSERDHGDLRIGLNSLADALKTPLR